MNNPGKLIARARRQRRIVAPQPAAAPAPTPIVPTPPPAPNPSDAAASPAGPANPRPAGGHALYSALMRSHDRMGTRHLNDPG